MTLGLSLVTSFITDNLLVMSIVLRIPGLVEVIDQSYFNNCLNAM